MKNKQTTAPLHQLGRALRTQIEDSLTCDQCQAFLPDYVQAEQETSEGIGQEQRLVAVRDHLALCPYCAAAYEQVREWLSDSLHDATPSAVAYPAFDLAFLESPASAAPPFAWPFALLQKRRQQGEQWLQDTAGALYLLFAPPPALAGAGWAVKSAADTTPLARTVLSEDDFPGWEIEATVFAISADLCRVEISLYAFVPLPDDLSGIGITLHDGITERAALTDANGLVEFDAVLRTRLDNLIVRVDLPGSDQNGSPINTKGAQ